MDLTLDLLDKASTIAAVATNNGNGFAAGLLEDWVKAHPDEAVQVMLTLVNFDQIVRDGHAAYQRGERDDITIDLERRYTAISKAQNKAYRSRQRSAKAKEGTS